MAITHISVLGSAPSLESLQALDFTDAAARVIMDTTDRAIARGMTGTIPSILILWTMLRWERKLGVAAIEAIGGDLYGLELALDASLNEHSRSLADFIDISCITRVTDAAVMEARTMGATYVGTEHILVALLDDDGELPGLATRFGITRDKVILGLASIGGRNESRPPDMGA